MTNSTGLLEALVAHDSTFGRERAIGDWLVKYLAGQGFVARKQIVEGDRFNVLAERGKGTATLLCYGHMDTVPVYNGWKTDPFRVTKVGDRLYGLGSCDMKGGIAGLLSALEHLPADVPVKLLLAVDEENESLGAWQVVRERRDWIDGVERILSVEPGASADRIGGADVLTLGRRGRARFRFTVHGYSSHGGHVDRGVNAIDIGARIAHQIDGAKQAFHPRLKEGSQYVASFNASSVGLSIPEYCELEVERLLVIPETIDDCLNEYNELCARVLASMEMPDTARSHVSVTAELVPRRNRYSEPYEIAVDDPLVGAARDAILEKLRPEHGPFINYGRSVGDENVFANAFGLPSLVLGPEGGNIHSPNEWVSLRSLTDVTEVYRDLLHRYFEL
ncbi:M20/M25/M40 family metallo-hydrolase [Streptomyces gardneri]|uniref:M20 family metallopeptidase n=1 Tax=Nocardia TaxID=1817 RepID=UPI0013567BBB|nr:MULTISPECIES: M20/M25/M40 family metallo-hydrolase [Nocardia]MBF6169112.1 M20/M25/M40 family metallo-hydrolase [Streptomyces gardneri]MBF6207312.1 M20/M25/M40 family metallo-hydrolase [Streptomyces gardneri]